MCKKYFINALFKAHISELCCHICILQSLRVSYVCSVNTKVNLLFVSSICEEKINWKVKYETKEKTWINSREDNFWCLTPIYDFPIRELKEVFISPDSLALLSRFTEQNGCVLIQRKQFRKIDKFSCKRKKKRKKNSQGRKYISLFISNLSVW